MAIASVSTTDGGTLRILHVTPLYEPAGTGGVVRSLSELCRSLRQLGHHVTVFATDSDGYSRMRVPIDRAVDVGGVEVYYFHTPMPGLFQYSPAMDRACRLRSGEFDIVDISACWNYCGIVAAKRASRASVPYVISPRGSLITAAASTKRIRKRLYMRLFGEKLVGGAAAIHYTSDLERQRTRIPCAWRPSFVISNAVDFSGLAARPSKTEARQALGLPEGGLTVGFLGRIHPIKALDVLIGAMARLDQAGNGNVRLLLAGPDDGDEARLRRIIGLANLGRQVHFIGPIHGDQKIQFLSALDVLALVSWSENFGNAAAEAMAAGVPVLVSNNVGISDDVDQTGSGWVVPVDAAAIANALRRIESGQAERERYGRNAKACVLDRYECGRVARLMARAYLDILSGNRSSQCRWSS